MMMVNEETTKLAIGIISRLTLIEASDDMKERLRLAKEARKIAWKMYQTFDDFVGIVEESGYAT